MSKQHEDDGEGFALDDEPITDEQLAQVERLIAAQERVAAIPDPVVRREQAIRFHEELGAK